MTAPDELDDREANLVLDMALRAGEVLLSGGAGASDVTASLMALSSACGLRRVEVDITFTSITLHHRRSRDATPVTSMRLVQQRATDYTRVTEVHNLVQDVVDGRLTRREASALLEGIRAARHPYPRWFVTVSRALLAAAVAVLLGAGLLVTGAAFVATVFVDLASRALTRRNVPVFYQNAVGAAIATSVALLLVAAEVGVRPSLVVAGGIILLLPGVTLVGAVQDAITGFYVTASARAFEVFLLTAGIIAGVGLALNVGDRLGVDVRLNAASVAQLAEVPVQALAAGVASAAFAAANHAPRRTLLPAGLAGLLGWAAFVAVGEAGLSPAFAAGSAAVVVGAVSYALARRQSAPPLLYVASGLIPLLPGLTIYRGMSLFAQGDTLGGIVTLGQAVSIGLALAAGAILGEFLGQPTRREVARHERRLVGPRLAGPLRWHRRG